MNPTLAQQPNRLASILNSPYRLLINTELHKILDQLYHSHPLITHLYYQLRLDTPPDKETNTHSKRLRGILCLLLSRGLGGSQARSLPVACAIELYHNASLIYDDIQDGSQQRCGRLALWCKVGIPEAINTALLLQTAAEHTLLQHSLTDRYYLVAFQELISAKALTLEGQTRDLQAQKHWREGMIYYDKTNRLKTGSLFATVFVLGTLTHLPHSEAQQQFYNVGIDLGLAHQIEDDIDDLIAFQNGLAKELDVGNIAYFLASDLGLLKESQQNSNFLMRLLKEPVLGVELQKKRENMQQQVKKSLLALKGINPEIRGGLYRIIHAILHRNDSVINKNIVESTC